MGFCRPTPSRAASRTPVRLSSRQQLHCPDASARSPRSRRLTATYERHAMAPSRRIVSLRPAASRLLLSRFRPYTIGFPPIKQPLALEAEATRFWVPQENGARKRRKFSYVLPIYMLSGIAFGAVRSPTVPSLEHGLSSLATPGTEACDAGGGAFRPQWREGPAP